MLCPHCRTENHDSRKTCLKCGKALVILTQSSPPPPPIPAPAYGAPRPPLPVPRPPPIPAPAYGVPRPPPPPAAMKPCPHCREMIAVGATSCRFCGRELPK